LASSEQNSPTIASPGYAITPEKQDMDLKSLFAMMMDDFKKEIQEKTGKQLEAFKEETQKSPRELQENTTKQVMELNKTIQELKKEVETIKKTQRETTLEIETLGKKSGTIDASISNRIQEMEENLRCRRFHREHGHHNQRKCKMQKDPNSNHPGSPGQNEKTKPTDNRSR
jgi:histone acetyltransferase (RNA polymerase elongator complex component)